MHENLGTLSNSLGVLQVLFSTRSTLGMEEHPKGCSREHGHFQLDLGGWKAKG